MGWSAIYLPSLPKGTEPRTCSGFDSREQAWKYARRFWCRECRRGYATSLRLEKKGDSLSFEDYVILYHPFFELDKNEENDWDMESEYIEYLGDYAACECEWVVIKDKDFDCCETVSDIFKAAGFKRVSKGDNK